MYGRDVPHTLPSAYLSAAVPRWRPRNESDLQEAIDNEIVNENHSVELKREIAKGSSHNRELARDLASLAVDGGLLIVGIEEDKATRKKKLAPQPLTRLAERVDQVARSIPDLPLSVITRDIAATGRPGDGYLLIHVPESPTAPHMVDHKYLGRGDVTKTYLSDGDVRRLHDRRWASLLDVEEMLRAEIARDPAGDEDAAHLFLLAQPLTARSDLALDLMTGGTWERRLLELGHAQPLGSLPGFSPDLSSVTRVSRRTDGVALSTHNLGPTRERLEGGDVAEVELHEDGGLRIYMSRLSDTLRDGGPVIFEVAVVLWTLRLLGLSRRVAEHGSYLGNWALGAAATGLRGKRAYESTQRWPARGNMSTLDADTYMQAGFASYAELASDAGVVASRLVGRLVRALGAEAALQPAFAIETA